MKRQLVHVVMLAVFIAGFTGCSKPPTEEIQATRDSVNTTVEAGAEVYAKSEFLALQAQMTTALDEVKTQDGKIFKKYDNAKQQLEKVKTEAAQLKALVVTRMEEAKQKSITALQAAQAAVAEAHTMLASAPKGKGTDADLEAMGADLKALDETLPAVQSMIDAGDYFASADKADATSRKAGEISAQVRQAMEKIARDEEERKKAAAAASAMNKKTKKKK